MPWRFLLCLGTVILVSTSGIARAQSPQPGWGPPGYCPPPYGSGGGPELIGERPFLYDTDARMDLIFRETLRRSWFRLDYLHWNIENPGNKLLGAPMATLDPRQPFDAFNPGNIPRIGVDAVVPDLADVDLDNMSGIRGTIGVPTQLGTLEVDAWGLAQASQSERIRPSIDLLTGATVLPAITLLSAGSPSDSAMVLFDTDYRNELRSNLFGTQANFYFNPMSTGSPLTFKPIAGFRYIRFHEELEIRGIDQTSGTTPRVSSSSHNNLFGPQIGFRTSVDNEWFSLGIEPKLMVGVNRHEDDVSASDILDPGNSVRHENNDTDFAPVIDLSSYLKLHVSKNCSLYAGYQLLILTNTSRPANQIRYNSPLISTDPPLIDLKKDRDSIFTHGLMVGGEFRFR